MTVILTMLRRVEPEPETEPVPSTQSSPQPSPHTRRLYHVTVPAGRYDLIKSIADLLVGESTSREYLDKARERCARIALAAVVEARTKMRLKNIRG